MLCWINSDHSQFKQFVSHRIGDLLEKNAADAATRTEYPIRYGADNLWIRGPIFLELDEKLWSHPKCIGNIGGAQSDLLC